MKLSFLLLLFSPVFLQAASPGPATTISVSISSSNSGVVTCANPTTTLSASTTASGSTTFKWTGPSSFTATGASITVSEAGVYTVKGTNSAGTGSASKTVTISNSAPDLSVTGATLGCASSVSIGASSTVSGATYVWAGPNDFSSTSASPVVTAAGTYTVTVKNPGTGCTNTKTVDVASGLSSLWLEGFSFANGTVSDGGATSWSVPSTPANSVFSVQGNEFRVSNTSSANGSESVWASGTIDITGKTDITLSANIRSSVNPGPMNSSGSNMDYLRFYYKLNGGNEVLFSEHIAAVNNHNTSNSAISVKGLSGSTVQIVVRARATGSDEFYYFDNVQVSGLTQSSMGVNASANTPITCTNTAVKLSGSATMAGVGYSWTGPNSFSSAVQNPTVSKEGVYTLKASSGLCSATDTALVRINTSAPDITANGGSVVCGSNITLTASSSVAGVNFSWTGPNGFTSSAANPAVSATGTYTATVTNPVNGCTASKAVTVIPGLSSVWLENFSSSNGTVSDAGSTSWSVLSTPANSVFSVQGNEFRVSNTSSATGSESVWASGTIDITGKTDVTLSANIHSSVNPGPMNSSGSNMDYLRFYYKLNGGAEVLFSEHIAAINDHSTTPTPISVSGLSGASVQIIVRARATGSDEFYYFDNVQVSAVSQGTISATAVANGLATCINNSATLSGSSNLAGVSYSWTGPGGFTSTAQNPAVSKEGIYTLTVAAGGCTATDTALVTANTALPDITATGGSLGCRSNITLVASSSVSGANFNWTGPNGFTSSSASPVVSVAGTYTATVTNPVNGCKASQSVTAGTGLSPLWMEDFTFANGTVSDPGATSWSVLSTPANSVFSVQGHEFRVSNTSSASGSESVWASGSIDITGKTDVTLSASIRSSVNPGPMNSSGSNMDYLRFYYKLNGGNEVLFSESIAGINNHSTIPTLISVSGLSGASVQIIVRARATGSDEFYYFDSVQVSAAGSGPANLSLVSGSGSTFLNCTNTTLNLNASSSTANASYNWSGPGGFTAAGSGVVISAAGSYSVTATDPVNGCTSTSILQINQNIAVPTAVSTTSVPVGGQLNCTQKTVLITGSSETPGVGYSWVGPDGFSANTTAVTATRPGDFILTVTDPSNGCSSTVTASVTENTTVPASVTANPSSILTCAQTSVTLTSNSTTSGVGYVWSGPNGFSSTSRVTSTTTAGAYTVTVTNIGTGCTASKTINVLQNITPPANVSIAPPDMLNCDVTSVQLTGSSTTANVLYIWSGPDDFSDVVPTTTVTEPGDYVLTVTDLGNSCSSTATVTVEQDLTACEAMARKLVSGKAAALTTASSDEVRTASGFQYKIYPNPVNNASSVHFTTGKSAHVQVVIFNGIGVREKVLFDGRAEAYQAYQLPIDVSRMAPGVHFCLIRVDDKVYSSKLLIAPGKN